MRSAEIYGPPVVRLRNPTLGEPLFIVRENLRYPVPAGEEDWGQRERSARFFGMRMTHGSATHRNPYSFEILEARMGFEGARDQIRAWGYDDSAIDKMPSAGVVTEGWLQGRG